MAEAEAAEPEVRRRRTALPALGGRSLNLLTRRLTLQVHQSLLGFCAGRAGAHEWENATPQDGTGGQAITESSPSPIFARGVEGEGSLRRRRGGLGDRSGGRGEPYDPGSQGDRVIQGVGGERMVRNNLSATGSGTRCARCGSTCSFGGGKNLTDQNQ